MRGDVENHHESPWDEAGGDDARTAFERVCSLILPSGSARVNSCSRRRMVDQLLRADLSRINRVLTRGSRVPISTIDVRYTAGAE